MPLLSVVMLTYNRKELVGNMLADIRNQSLVDFEFIVVDNGSDDGTEDVLNSHAGEDPRLRVLRLPKSSIGRGRNAGIAAASGEYITFVDDDDRVDADYLDFLLALLDNGKNDVAICGTDESLDGVNFAPQCVFNERITVGPEEAVKLLLERKHIRAGLAGKCLRTILFRQYPFKEDCIHEDIFTVYKYLADAPHTAMWGVPKYHCLRHGNNCSYYTTDGALWTPTEMSEYMAAFHERTEFLSKRFPNMAAFARYCEWSFMLSMLEKITRFSLKDCEQQHSHIVEVLKSNRAEFFFSPFLKNFEKGWLQLLDGEIDE